LELLRQIGVSYPTSWKIKHKLMEAMKDRDGQYFFGGIIHVDDAYFRGELNGAKAGGDQTIRFRLLWRWK
jgi:hypothetical protein